MVMSNVENIKSRARRGIPMTELVDLTKAKFPKPPCLRGLFDFCAYCPAICI